MIRRIILSTTMFFLMSLKSIFGAEADRLFLDGNRLYQAGNYQDALTAYAKILQSGYESGPLYYNMGNCYYKLSDIGRSILFYERASRLMPKDDEVKANLSMANLSAVDKIEPQGDFLLVAAVNGFVRWIPKSIGTVMALVFYVLGMTLLTVWIIARKRLLRAVAIRLSLSFIALSVVLGLTLYAQIRDVRTGKEAVILADKVDVLSAPGGEGVEVFSLHAGTKVRTDQQTGEWIEIILPDRKVGWVKRDVLERI